VRAAISYQVQMMFAIRMLRQSLISIPFNGRNSRIRICLNIRSNVNVTFDRMNETERS
ncbi:hypothetical protein LOAG_15110, partial [Loa loa]